MSVPCVAVARERGETVRSRLADADALDGDHQIAVDGQTIYIPVADRELVPAAFADRIVERDAERRDRPTTPADILGYEPSIERLGDIVIVDEDDDERAREIADAVAASDVPCETVLNRASPIEGELRVRSWDVLVGDDTETVHREYGHEFALDVAAVYFSPRLATERHRVAEQVDPGESAIDMFAGVGPYAVPMASRGADVVACDLNERAVEYLRENAARNGVTDRVTAISGDVRDLADSHADTAERLVMNLPHSADEFLDTAVALAGDDCVIHYYDIQHEDDPFGPGRRAIEAAAGDDYAVTVETERVVRSYAPHEHNVCLDARLTRDAD
ncbi:class I SAM-dependent methyltransferase family protein [Halorubrum ezzemoulense]|uniref:class I SAM-dependent methyltransferase n=1 Tax=Halorubrum ezzemoulense TaxID=337243 RepID=UPI00232FD1ED|nr:class I SAM-dependent methyltransferase family protein [Halorubrum ezzemoulense]MDB2225079.1 class I SAM-dependent methyltransferase family protein [Halorubrum ezzemoulense]MDB2270026.1 class I SAM-dependent methyltransferase family protein [Halorubrum ezzemoulense]MDB2273439.1 class I SAM-dependent methyltransferase family protein [Halorubrum ezzemoulense]